MVGDGKDGYDVVLAQQTHEGGHRGIVLLGVVGVGAVLAQVALLVVTLQDPRQHIGAVGFIVEGRLSGEDQQVSAVLPPANALLGPQRWEGRDVHIYLTTINRAQSQSYMKGLEPADGTLWMNFSKDLEGAKHLTPHRGSMGLRYMEFLIPAFTITPPPHATNTAARTSHLKQHT